MNLQAVPVRYVSGQLSNDVGVAIHAAELLVPNHVRWHISLVLLVACEMWRAR